MQANSTKFIWVLTPCCYTVQFYILVYVYIYLYIPLLRRQNLYITSKTLSKNVLSLGILGTQEALLLLVIVKSKVSLKDFLYSMSYNSSKFGLFIFSFVKRTCNSKYCKTLQVLNLYQQAVHTYEFYLTV